MTDNIKDKKARPTNSVSAKISQQLQIKCQCSVIKQNIQINLNKKSKFSVVILDSKTRQLKIFPYSGVTNRSYGTNTNQKEVKLQAKQEQKIVFAIRKLKMIHKKYIEQGKITLEFSQYYQNKVISGMDFSANDQKEQITSTVLISNANKENLELMIQKMLQIKRQIKQELQQKNTHQIKKQTGKRQKEESKSDQHRQNPRKCLPTISHKQRQKSHNKMTRKQLIQLATCPQKIKAKKKVENLIEQKKCKQISLFELPNSLLKLIFLYTEVRMEMRLVSKQFSQFTLQNIGSLRFREEVDQETFNKLAKYAVNVQGRLKNVRNLSLLDQFDRISLEKNYAKSLHFGTWKQISNRNIQQIRHLRIYLLELPYSIKFDFTALFGLRLVHLRLKGRHITQRNLFVRDQDIQKFVKVNKSLQKLEVAYASQKILVGLTAQQKQRITELSIGTLNLMSENMSWINFQQFKNLKSFSVQKVLRQGIDCKLDLDLILPEGLTHCEIGQYLSLQSFTDLPKKITNLTLRGRKFTSQDLNNLPLPNLRFLDISQCLSIGSDGLRNLQFTRVLTCWDRNTIKICQDRFKDLIIQTTQ